MAMEDEDKLENTHMKEVGLFLFALSFKTHTHTSVHRLDTFPLLVLFFLLPLVVQRDNISIINEQVMEMHLKVEREEF